MKSSRDAQMMANAPLPMRNGVAPSRVYLPPGPWSTVLEFLIDRFQFMPPDILRARLEQGCIVDQDGMAQQPGTRYQPSGWLWYYRDVPDEMPVPFELDILYRDDRIVVVDKPHFLASIPGGRHLRETALTRLRHVLDLPHLTPIHRLDRETAGVMLFCADPASRGAYQSLFQSRDVRKEYEAIAPWRADLALPCRYRSRLAPADTYFTMKEEPGEPNSETWIELLERRDRVALYRLSPLTGRKHQLRAHLSALGIPICNDGFYPYLHEEKQADDFEKPLQLLARAIEFMDPFSGKSCRFESKRRLSLWYPDTDQSEPNTKTP